MSLLLNISCITENVGAFFFFTGATPQAKLLWTETNPLFRSKIVFSIFFRLAELDRIWHTEKIGSAIERNVEKCSFFSLIYINKSILKLANFHLNITISRKLYVFLIWPLAENQLEVSFFFKLLGLNKRNAFDGQKEIIFLEMVPICVKMICWFNFFF